MLTFNDPYHFLYVCISTESKVTRFRTCRYECIDCDMIAMIYLTDVMTMY